MKLKHRLEKIENQLGSPIIRKLWYISGEIEDQEKLIESIKAGKIEHKDGGFYKDSDKFLIVKRIIVDKTPIKVNEESSNEAIAEQVRKLKEKKEILENEIKEGKK